MILHVAIITQSPAVSFRESTNQQSTQKAAEGILIGVRKGGTGAILRFLAINPRIKIHPGEVLFLIDDELYRKGMEWHIKEMPFTTPGEISFEKSADYFTDPKVPERIRQINPKQKLLLTFRDPVIRLVSEHYFLLRRCTLGKSVSYCKVYGNKTLDEIYIRRNPHTGAKEVNTEYEPMMRSLYHVHLKRWFAIFPREQILIIDGDNFAKNNPAGPLRKVEEFLGVEPFIKESMFYHDDDKGFYCPVESGCIENKGHSYAYPSQDAIDILRRYFKPHNEKLFEMLGYRYHWK
ncbi:hypothetical protein CAPTEDRAFT_97729 [Capitella teleta]|uniref:Sulfotransferase domain-containing protein n=1 Tax=Capitella teleta TaxID=283909 RepID=R7VF04_CAPTE|nr:hypothetical protein CAPTEDRAFT_97729 [Capitella teleta]|eukprot:ELU14891.1 hypothetical protein CAPTEDRAFT_97729 [Capitella teleta]